MIFPSGRSAFPEGNFLHQVLLHIGHGSAPVGQQDFDLSRMMISYLTNFSKTGNPNKPGELPTWIAPDKSQKKVMYMGQKPAHMGCLSMLRLVKAMLYNKAVGE